MPVIAQINMPTKGKKLDAQQKEQIQIDEQLASQYFREQDYEKARDLYEKIFAKTNQTGYFQQYIECLFHLKDYDKAERELKSFAKKNPSYSKAVTDLIYVYTMQGKTDKAKKQYNELVKDLPDHAPTIRNLSYGFQSRGLNDMALAVLRFSMEKKPSIWTKLTSISHRPTIRRRSGTISLSWRPILDNTTTYATACKP